MDVTSAINSLGNDYVAKVTDAMKQSAAVNNTNGSAANQTFDSIFNAVSGLVNSTNDYVQQRIIQRKERGEYFGKENTGN